MKKLKDKTKILKSKAGNIKFLYKRKRVIETASLPYKYEFDGIEFNSIIKLNIYLHNLMDDASIPKEIRTLSSMIVSMFVAEKRLNKISKSKLKRLKGGRINV